MPIKPAVELSYDFKGYNRVRNALRKLASEYRKEIDSTVKGWVKEEKEAIRSHGYPAQSNAPQPFKTERQRRWFFWALGTGQINVPYKRTGKLASSWRVEKVTWGEYALKNSQAYAHWVIEKKKQAVYHEGHWWTADDFLDRDTPELVKRITEKLTDVAGDEM